MEFRSVQYWIFSWRGVRMMLFHRHIALSSISVSRLFRHPGPWLLHPAVVDIARGAILARLGPPVTLALVVASATPKTPNIQTRRGDIFQSHFPANTTCI